MQARKLKEGFVEALQRGQMQVMAKCKGMLDSRKAAAEAKQEENRTAWKHTMKMLKLVSPYPLHSGVKIHPLNSVGGPVAT